MNTTRLARISVLACGLLPPAVLATAWFVARWDDLIAGPLSFLDAFSDLPALLGLSGFVVLMALGTRFSWVEHRFGLDRMFRFHKQLARWVVGLFAAHGLLRTWHYALHHGRAWDWSYLFYFGTGDWGLLIGHLAFYTVLAAAGLALLGARRRLSFRLWKSGHLAVYVVVTLGFVHAALKGSDDLANLPTGGMFVVLVGAALVLLICRAIYSLRRGRSCTWLVDHLEPETYDTTSLVAGRESGPGRFAERCAGQFAVIRVRQGLGWSEPHPFTISCAPESERLRFTIKAVGRFSSAVPLLAPRTPLLCEGPYGIFCPDFDYERRIVMIAGGVGITPFLSQLRHAVLAAPEVRVTLIWANKTSRDLIAGDELLDLTACLHLTIIHVLSREPAGSLPAATDRMIYARGHVDRALLTRHIEDPAAAHWYLCGPAPMQEAVLGHLRAAFGISPGQVKRELFFY